MTEIPTNETNAAVSEVNTQKLYRVYQQNGEVHTMTKVNIKSITQKCIERPTSVNKQVKPLNGVRFQLKIDKKTLQCRLKQNCAQFSFCAESTLTREVKCITAFFS